MVKGNGAEDWANKQVFTTGEAADICKVSQQTIIRCFDSGRLQGFRVPGSKFRRIPRAELLRFMKANDIPTDVLESTRKRVLVVDDDEQIVELFLDVQNLYDQKNVAGYQVDDRSFTIGPDGEVVYTPNEEYWLGILPSFGVKWSF